MTSSTQLAAPRLHPLVVAAAASVTLVSIVGAAAILGWFPASNGNALPAGALSTQAAQPTSLAPAVAPYPVQLAAAMPQQVTPTRFQTADGRVFEEVSAAHPVVADAVAEPVAAPVTRKPVQAVRHKVVHHRAAESNDQPRETQQQAYAAQHPVRSYVSDMHPVGTGVGAVLGGVLGHQVGGGNGKKLATVAGALLGGYAGNEVAHDRNPLPFGNP